MIVALFMAALSALLRSRLQGLKVEIFVVRVLAQRRHGEPQRDAISIALALRIDGLQQEVHVLTLSAKLAKIRRAHDVAVWTTGAVAVGAIELVIRATHVALVTSVACPSSLTERSLRSLGSRAP